MVVAELPFMKFFPSDWTGSSSMRGISWAARGVMIELVCIMWDLPQPGRLIRAGKVLTVDDIVRLLGNDPKQTRAAFNELVECRAITQDSEGVYVCARMVKDYRVRMEAKNNGKKGGNPNVSAPVERTQKPVRENSFTGETGVIDEITQGVNPTLNPSVNPQTPSSGLNPESRVHIPYSQNVLNTYTGGETPPDGQLHISGTRVEQPPPDPPAKPAKVKTVFTQQFKDFWAAYPPVRKYNIKECFTLWKRHNLDQPDNFAGVMRSLERWKACPMWTNDGGKFVKSPAVWLRQENYKEKPPRDLSAGERALYANNTTAGT